MILTPNTELAQNIAARAAGRSGGIKQIAEGRSDVFKVNPFNIEVEPGFNVRDFESEEVKDHIDGLAQSIAQIGVQRALTVRNKGGRLFLKDGECRLRAVVRAIEVYGSEIVTVPVRLAERHESDADAVLGILVENSGLPLDALAKSNVVKRLKAFGWSDTDIALKTGMSKSYVIRLLELSGLDEEVKTLVRSGVVSATLALDTARANDFDGEKTVQAINDAKVVAEAKGKARVTKAAVSGKAGAVSVRQQVAEILNAADVDKTDLDGDETVYITMSGAEWAKVCELLKLTA
jgi:ParB-like chromosome segregation protein Spo0J